MRIANRWTELLAMFGPDLQRVTPLGLREALNKLRQPKAKSVANPAAPRAFGVQDLDETAAGDDPVDRGPGEPAPSLDTDLRPMVGAVDRLDEILFPQSFPIESPWRKIDRKQRRTKNYRFGLSDRLTRSPRPRRRPSPDPSIPRPQARRSTRKGCGGC